MGKLNTTDYNEKLVSTEKANETDKLIQEIIGKSNRGNNLVQAHLMAHNKPIIYPR